MHHNLFVLKMFVWEDTKIRLYYENNYLDVTSTSSGTQYLQHNLTINNGTSTETSDFEVAEIIVFNKELSLDEENTMVNYLKQIS